MFTGIIEGFATVNKIIKDGGNYHFTLESEFTNELKIDQSVAHNGVCLTVIEIKDSSYTVTAIEETLQKTAIGELKIGSKVNLERAMLLGSRLDGHLVQGHVDQVGVCSMIKEQNGSRIFTFEYDPSFKNITVEKGSVTINGVSLTVVASKTASFSVAIIPYTYEHTNFHQIEIGTKVNLEFDIIGKYMVKLATLS